MIFWMGVNGGGSRMSGWGLSRASKRAKEHEKSGLGGGSYGQNGVGSGLISGGAGTGGCEVRVPGGGWARCGCPVVQGAGTRWWPIWAKIFGERPNSVDFVVGRVGIVGEGLDPLAKHQIHGPKQPNLTRSNKLQDFFWAIFVGIFEFGRKTTKSS